jgi:hypothetical protein
MFTHVLNRAALMQARLTSQFQGLPGLAAIVAGHGAQSQAIEDMLFGIYSGWTLPNCVGDALTRVGRTVGLPRPVGMLDAVYLPLVQAQIIVNTSNGSPETLLSIMRILGATMATYTRPATMAVNISFTGTTLASDADITGALLAATGPVDLNVQFYDPVTPFRFDTGPGFDVGKLGRNLL